MSTAIVAEDVRRVLSTVHDPELPDVSIVDLGLLEHVEVAPRRDLGRSATRRIPPTTWSRSTWSRPTPGVRRSS